jgi:hypothetical protein
VTSIGEPLPKLWHWLPVGICLPLVFSGACQSRAAKRRLPLLLCNLWFILPLPFFVWENERLLSLRWRYNLRPPVHNGLWLSLVERHVRDVEAVGSNPTSPTRLLSRSEESTARIDSLR